jgi:hypothetical protein
MNCIELCGSRNSRQPPDFWRHSQTRRLQTAQPHEIYTHHRHVSNTPVRRKKRPQHTLNASAHKVACHGTLVRVQYLLWMTAQPRPPAGNLLSHQKDIPC